MLQDPPRSSTAALGVLAPAFFVAAVFVSAALLFSVQPIIARMALPLLGGSPAVWTTAMLFFQAALLAGYLYAHLLATRFAFRAQVLIHSAALIAGALFLPIGLPSSWEFTPGSPITLQVLLLFAAAVALPFFAISANAPLLQRWYAASGRHDAHDPYYLYAASNVGSIAALLAYPLVFEPLLGTHSISIGWAIAYGFFGFAFAACAMTVPVAGRREPVRKRPVVPALRFVRWIALAFIPSSLMLWTTQVIATDLGSFPLLWVIPLALYLLTFVITFARRLRVPGRVLAFSFRVTLILSIVMMAAGVAGMLGWIGFALLLATFFSTALFLHSRLYEDRPEPAALTGFYLAMSIGGVLGGVFNALFAPMLFDSLLEGPIVLALAGLALPGAVRLRRDLVVGAVMIGALFAAGALAKVAESAWSMPSLYLLAGLSAILLVIAMERPVRFALLAAGIFVAVDFVTQENAVHRSRSFFGVYTVRDDLAEGLRHLAHGTTLHGHQWIAEPAPQPEVLSYYHRNGPMGQITLAAGPEARIGIVGLGIGALACHAKPGQRWTFFEIDPEVDRIARDPSLFSYMNRCGREMPTVIGDARVMLERSADEFDLLVIDAFSSDAIPVHLLTLEAIRLYGDRLAPGGILLVHISNRYFDLAPVLGRTAAALDVKAFIAERRDGGTPPLARGENPSIVVLLTRGEAPEDGRWRPLSDDGGAPWTDDHANLLGALR